MVSLSPLFFAVVFGAGGVIVAVGAAVVARRLDERERREWLRDTLQCIQEAVILTDARGAITAMNERAVAMTGWPEAEAIGQPVGAVFRLVDVRTRRPVVNPLVKALHQRTAVGPSEDTLLIGRDGTEWLIRDKASPIRDDRGRTFGGALAFRDLPRPRANLYVVR